VWRRGSSVGVSRANDVLIELLNTPDDAFENLPDWPFERRMVTVDAGSGPVQMAVWEAGDGPTVLLLHGEPSWAYLYRKMMPLLVAAGRRVVVPDLVGFGASQKPTEQADHSYANHVAWMSQLLHDELELTDVVVFLQDWGGLIGLRCVAAAPERYAGLVVSNTGLPTGDQTMPDAFLQWRAYASTADPFPVGGVLQGGTQTELTPAEVAAYDAPFVDTSFQAGPKVMPSLVPAEPNDPEAAAQRAAWTVLQGFEAPVLTAFSDGDQITAGGQKVFHKLVPGAVGQDHRIIEGGGHFVQEDQPHACVDAILAIPID
jgi:haloalkane dehalogenase